MSNLFNKTKAGVNEDNGFQNTPLICPRCHIYMKKIQKNGVMIDVCTKCKGLWLDNNEIDKLIDM